MKLKETIKQYMQHCEFEKRASKDTIKAYGIDLLQFSKFCESELQFESDEIELNLLDRDLLKRFIHSLNMKKYKVKTVKRKISSVKGLFSYLKNENIIEKNPLNDIRLDLRDDKRIPTTMDLDEISIFLKAVYSCKSGAKPGSKASLLDMIHYRDIAVIEMLFATGLRVHELCNLTFQNFDLNNRSIKIMGKGRKERFLYIADENVMDSVKMYLEYVKRVGFSSEYIFLNKFGRKLSCQAVRGIVDKYCNIARLDKNVTPHVFRHSFATLLLDNGVDIKFIQELLGHSSITTTQIYLHVSQKSIKQVLTENHPRKQIEI